MVEVRNGLGVCMPRVKVKVGFRSKCNLPLHLKHELVVKQFLNNMKPNYNLSNGVGFWRTEYRENTLRS